MTEKQTDKQTVGKIDGKAREKTEICLDRLTNGRTEKWIHSRTDRKRQKKRQANRKTGRKTDGQNEKRKKERHRKKQTRQKARNTDREQD